MTNKFGIKANASKFLLREEKESSILAHDLAELPALQLKKARFKI